MKQILIKIASATCLLAGALALSNCASGPVTQMNASSVDSKELAADSRTALNKLYKTN